MKKITALILALIMALALCACNKDDPTIGPEYEDTTTSGIDLSQYEGTYLKPYVELIASGNYQFRQYESDGTSYSTYLRVNGDEKVETSSGYDFVKRASDGKIFLVQGKYYIELNNALAEQSEKIATILDQIDDIFTAASEVPNAFLALVKIDDFSDVNISGFAYHEEYKAASGYIYIFGFDASGALTEFALYNPTTKASIENKIAIEEVSPNAVSTVFELGEQLDTDEYLSQITTD